MSFPTISDKEAAPVGTTEPAHKLLRCPAAASCCDVSEAIHPRKAGVERLVLQDVNGKEMVKLTWNQELAWQKLACALLLDKAEVKAEVRVISVG